MNNQSIPRLIAAERLNGGVIIAFDDGKCAVYSASLLYTTLGQAEIVSTELEDETPARE
ncbi:hypothetical protein [Granulicella arctica]|uniref:hypothetical protein n=1 Tax=Granulicella arctica TaxID=940613 RepID=UPI0021DFB7EA|nr:hypothetical protein [Granulicella arctica]